ncbi:hypothetical protein CASFOL_034548 [Castilleja foliolosa]|uniref:Uncharacterized protein n=1 Tax=Castilleja foliolosa TaxID=1961234 RepID=A0ABD3BR87_9LAMI
MSVLVSSLFGAISNLRNSLGFRPLRPSTSLDLSLFLDNVHSSGVIVEHSTKYRHIRLSIIPISRLLMI